MLLTKTAPFFYPNGHGRWQPVYVETFPREDWLEKLSLTRERLGSDDLTVGRQRQALSQLFALVATRPMALRRVDMDYKIGSPRRMQVSKQGILARFGMMSIGEALYHSGEIGPKFTPKPCDRLRVYKPMESGEGGLELLYPTFTHSSRSTGFVVVKRFNNRGVTEGAPEQIMDMGDPATDTCREAGTLALLQAVKHLSVELAPSELALRQQMLEAIR